jgi:hypothetical protein
VVFEASLQESRTTASGETVPIIPDHVQEALKAVTETVFPHCTLETQKLWMNRKMFKPVELTTRQMTASTSRLNNSLTFFLMLQKRQSSQKESLMDFLSGLFQPYGEPSLIWMVTSPCFIQGTNLLKSVRRNLHGKATKERPFQQPAKKGKTDSPKI